MIPPRIRARVLAYSVQRLLKAGYRNAAMYLVDADLAESVEEAAEVESIQHFVLLAALRSALPRVVDELSEVRAAVDRIKMERSRYEIYGFDPGTDERHVTG